MRVTNECRVDFQYRLSPKSPIVMKTTFSNVVSTDIVKNILKVDKFVDKMNTYSFDILTYTIVISNISNFIVTNVHFRDDIADNTMFIVNSVEIDGQKKRGLRPDKGFYIGNIAPGCRINIEFRVRILPNCFNRTINNYSIIDHDYTYNIEEKPIKMPVSSNNVSTEVRNKVFKQFTVDNNIEVTNDISSIEDFEVHVKILKLKTVNTPTSSVYKSYKSKVCTLIAIGTLEYNISYKTSQNSKSKKNKTDVIKNTRRIYGFSTYMLVPVGITLSDKNKITVKIHNASVNILNKNSIITSTNLLLYY
ncbi:hypothetical protein CHL78_004730 [Romboutsia weinsteinii]|uniref:DUF11 domain-containing protein n=1 Tax=Romboutsia weinsteinii TaxID=2020949 RepID=A0A371J6Y1_9FIRM|nr:hypothetical protein [Romboutsia weinsteinii]RDY28495.1 hypothetical protein CHL78_004730 [Romboutsia weinsteinii]